MFGRVVMVRVPIGLELGMTVDSSLFFDSDRACVVNYNGRHWVARSRSKGEPYAIEGTPCGRRWRKQLAAAQAAEATGKLKGRKR